MAILQNINDKLDQLTGEVAAESEPLTAQDIAPVDPLTFDEPQIVGDGEKVAGLGSAVFKGATKRAVSPVQRGIERVEGRAEQAVKERIKTEEAARKAATEKEVARVQKAAAERVKPMTPAEIEAGKAQAIGGAPGEAPMGAPRAVFNYNKYDPDIATTLESVATHYGISHQPMTITEMTALAKHNGIGAEYIGELAVAAREAKDLPVLVVRAHLTMPTIASDMQEISKKLAAATDQTEIAALHTQYEAARDTLLATMYMAKGFQVPVGQAMRVMQEFRPAMSGDLAKVIANDKLFAEALANTIGTKNLVRLLEKGNKVGFVKDLWMSTYINGMLSATGTHAINITTTGLFLAKQGITREIAAFSGDVRNAISKMSGQGAIEDRVMHGEGLAGIVGMLNGSRDALVAAGGTLRTGKTLGQRIDESIGLQSDPQTWMELKNVSGLDAAQYGYDGATAMALTKWAQLVALPGRALSTADDFFKQMGYSFETSALAYRESKAYQKSLIANGEDVVVAESKAADRYLELMDNPSAEIDAAAIDFGRMVTFTRELGDDTLIGKFNNYANDHTIAKVVFPFIRTPTWLVSEAAQHSPLAPLSRQWRQDIAEGGAKRDMALAKMGEGTVAFMALAPLIQDGSVTGPGPFNADVRKRYMETGWRPFSIRVRGGGNDAETIAELKKSGIEFDVVSKTIDPAIAEQGDIYIKYAQLAPISGPLAMASAFYEYARYNKDPEDEVTELAFASALALGELTKQIPVFTSVSDLVYAFSREDKSFVRNLSDYATNQSVKFAIEGSPAGAYSSLMAQTERFMNNQTYEIKVPPNTPPGVGGAYEAVLRKMSRTPMLSSNIPVALNFWGEPLKVNDPEYMPLSAANIRVSGYGDPASAILAELGIKAKEPDQYITIGGIRTQLTNDQHRELRMMFNTPFDNGGQQTTIKALIVNTVTGQKFLDLPRAKQQGLIVDLLAKGRKMAEMRMLVKPKTDDKLPTDEIAALDDDDKLTPFGLEVKSNVKRAREQMNDGSRDYYDTKIRAYK